MHKLCSVCCCFRREGGGGNLCLGREVEEGVRDEGEASTGTGA